LQRWIDQRKNRERRVPNFFLHECFLPRNTPNKFSKNRKKKKSVKIVFVLTDFSPVKIRQHFIVLPRSPRSLSLSLSLSLARSLSWTTRILGSLARRRKRKKLRSSTFRPCNPPFLTPKFTSCGLLCYPLLECSPIPDLERFLLPGMLSRTWQRTLPLAWNVVPGNQYRSQPSQLVPDTKRTGPQTTPYTPPWGGDFG